MSIFDIEFVKNLEERENDREGWEVYGLEVSGRSFFGSVKIGLGMRKVSGGR